MKYHIVLTKIHAERIRKESLRQSDAPRSDLTLLAQSLNAVFIEQQDYPIESLDRVRAQFSGTPANWAYARAIASQLKTDDVVFCPGEEIGIPLASVCGNMPERPKIIVWFHRITGLRTRVALKLFNIKHRVNLAVVSSRPNQEFLSSYLGFSPNQILFWWHPIDGQYFQPRTAGERQTPPIIMSVGLEFRDYKLLAAATAQLNVEVKIAGFSQFQSRVANILPAVMPANMSNKKYLWSELIELYHTADLAVVCLKENVTAAGITVLLEAMACRKPIICTRTQGLDAYLSDEQAVMTIEPGDVTGLQRSIIYLLEHPQEAQSRANRAYDLVHQRHNLDEQVEVLTQFIRTVEQ